MPHAQTQNKNTQTHASWSFHRKDIQTPKLAKTFLMLSSPQGNKTVEAKHIQIGTRRLWLDLKTNRALSPDSIIGICLTPDILRKTQQNNSIPNRIKKKLPKNTDKIDRRKRKRMPLQEVTPQDIENARKMVSRIKEAMKDWKPRSRPSHNVRTSLTPSEQSRRHMAVANATNAAGLDNPSNP